MVNFISLLLISATSAAVSKEAALGPESDYKTMYFTQPVDHINRNPGTFQVKALVRTGDPDAPMFVYTGNEGPIEQFFRMTGWLTGYLGPKYNATVAFIEHRYYGDSQISPFTWDYLDSTQALWDYADITRQLKPKPSTPVIAIGGSYGGMLSAFFRIKFPHIVDGAIASSAPVIMAFNDGKGYSDVVTLDYNQVDKNCPENIESGFTVLQNLATRPMTYSAVEGIFKPCQSITSQADIYQLEDWITNAIMTIAQYNYPYKADVYGELPAYPVNFSCSIMAEYIAPPSNVWRKLSGLYQIANVFYNSTGDKTCFDIYGTTASVGRTWTYQTCTEFLMPLGQYGPPNDIFPKRPWNQQMWEKQCKAMFGVENKPSWEEINYGMIDEYQRTLKFASNIVFSYGTEDPWKVGCLKQQINTETLVLEIQGAAHHLDLRTPEPKDPQSVKNAREKEEELIQQWISNKRFRPINY